MEARDQERLDQLLDQALGKMGTAEPRMGLENRVLARIREEREARAHVWGRWRVVGAVAIGVALVLTILLVERPSPVPTITSQRDAGATKAALPKSAAPIASALMPRRKLVRAGHAHEGRRDAVTTRLQQFPSPAPLSEQEIILARYVREFGDRAVLVARAQTELRRQDEAEYQRATRKQPHSEQE